MVHTKRSQCSLGDKRASTRKPTRPIKNRPAQGPNLPPPPRQPATVNVNVVDVVVVVEVRRRESKRVVHRHTKYTNRNPKITADNP